MDRELVELLAKAKARVEAMTPDELAEMKREQRASFIRAMTTPCEHRVLDFEQCGDCWADVMTKDQPA